MKATFIKFKFIKDGVGGTPLIDSFDRSCFVDNQIGTLSPMALNFDLPPREEPITEKKDINLSSATLTNWMGRSLLLPNFSQRDPVEFFRRFTGDPLKCILFFKEVS